MSSKPAREERERWSILIRMNRLLLLAIVILPAAALHASADLSVSATPPSGTVVRAGGLFFVNFTVHNAGPDTATGNVVTFNAAAGASEQLCSNGCPVRDLAPGEDQPFTFDLRFPTTPGDMTLSASVQGSTPDPNQGNNTGFMTVTVSPDPDVGVFLGASLPVDLGVPFTLAIYLGNASAVVAHDVEVTVDFRPDVGIRSLPSGCSSPAAGRIVCHADQVATAPTVQQPLFTLTLTGPPAYGSGSITFAASVTEREHDFDPASNTSTLVTPLYLTFYVTSTANDGPGSLRQAILDANASTGSPLAIGFRIEEPSTTAWKTIRITSPLPPITNGVRVDGAIQSGFFGDSNPDGPEIEISGGGDVDGNGMVVTSCGNEIANLTINGFRSNGVAVVDPPNMKCVPYSSTILHDLFIGTDPTGSEARPNGQRGIGTSVTNGTDFNGAGLATSIYNCVLSGNAMSGVFALSGRVIVAGGNRIGVKAHSDEALPNGASGIFIGPGGYGSVIGFNVIAFNREMGVAIARGVNDVSVRGNRIWSNGSLGIDVGLDGPTLSVSSEFGLPVGVPALTLAHYDPASNMTIVEGDTAQPPQGIAYFTVDLYSNDATDPSGFGEGQRPAGTTQPANFTSATHFRVALPGDLTGQFITATTTRTNYIGFAKPDGLDQGFLTQTSEFSRAIEVR